MHQTLIRHVFPTAKPSIEMGLESAHKDSKLPDLCTTIPFRTVVTMLKIVVVRFEQKLVVEAKHHVADIEILLLAATCVQNTDY